MLNEFWQTFTRVKLIQYYVYLSLNNNDLIAFELDIPLYVTEIIAL